MKIKDIIDIIESAAPLSFQEEWDNSGLQVCPFEDGVDHDLTKVLVSLDITEEVIDEAARKGCNLVLSHHPLIFRPLKSVSNSTMVQRCVIKAVQKGVAVYSAHTSLDNAHGGVNFKIASMLGLRNLRFLEASQENMTAGSGLYGTFKEHVPVREFLEKVKTVFGVDAVSWTGPEDKTIYSVVLCGGAGGFLLQKARKARVDCFLSGEISYHDFFDTGDMVVASIGHYQSEQFTAELIIDIVKAVAKDVVISKAESMSNPVKTLK